jgi:hypothetical protein
MKKHLLLGLLLAGYLTTLTGQVSFGEPRLFNDNWTFQKGDVTEASKPTYDDNRWRRVQLPHDWSVEGPLSPDLASATGYLPGGVAWYRKAFDLTPELKGKRVYIYFEGVYNYGEVFINGHSLGIRPNGYISYLHDLTAHLTEGRNVIAVRVDHSKYADSRWYTGSGIYRDVYLVAANPVHIAQWGVFFTTPEITPKRAKAVVETTLKNTTTSDVTLRLEQNLVDPNGHIISKVHASVKVPAGQTATFPQLMHAEQPLLWSLEKPHLYTLETRVLQNGSVIDKTNTKVGFRQLTFDPNKGFALNGTWMKVKGVCLHHDAGCLGAAVPASVWRNRLMTLKAMGVNAIRTSHNPQAPALYDLCDELGLLVMNEAFDEWEFPKKKWVSGWNQGKPAFDGPSAFFNDWGERDLKDMVQRDRNHPSVFMWSIGNEVDYPNDPYSHPILDKEGIQQQHTAGYQPNQPHADRLGAIAKRLAAVVRANDPTRPVTAGLAGPVMSNETDYPGALDVAGYNYTERRYAQDHAKYPKRVLYGSENGHGLDAWKAVTDNDYIFGQFLWTGLDYLGEAGAWPSRGFTTGLLDLAGFKKPRAYFRESLWSTNPMIYIGTSPRFRSNRPSTDAPPVWNYQAGASVQVSCYTNCEQAKLLLNGQPFGEPTSRDASTGVIAWEVPFQAGTLEAVGLNGGKEVARFALKTSGRPYAIVATPSVTTLSGQPDVVEITVQVVDDKGLPVFMADDEISCRIQGKARLLGMESSHPSDMGDYTDFRQRVYQGRLKAYVRPAPQAGPLTITFSANWLQEAVVTLE